MDLELPEDLGREVAELGKFRAEFATSKKRLIGSLIVGSVFVVAGVVFLGIGIAGVFDVLPWGLSRIRMIVGGILGGIVMVLGGILVPWRYHRSRKVRVLVFLRGLVRLDGEHVNVCRWDEVETICDQAIDKADNMGLFEELHRFAIRRADGTELAFDESLPRVRKLRKTIDQETLHYLLPVALKTCSDHQTVEFGQLQVDGDGLHHDQESLHWSEVKEVDVRKRKVTITKQGQWSSWFCADVSEIPNLHVFRALVSHHREPYRG